MSVIVYYQPMKSRDSLEGATSSTVKALKECFGDLPIKLAVIFDEDDTTWIDELKESQVCVYVWAGEDWEECNDCD